MRLAVPLVLLGVLAARAAAQCPDGTPPPCAARVAVARAVPAPAERARHLMFLPFRNVSRQPDHDWLVSGAPLMLGQVLGQFRELSVVSEERLAAARRRLRIPADSVPDAVQLRRLAGETGGWTAVSGTVLATGARIQVTLQATDVPSGRVLLRTARDVQQNADLRGTFDALGLSLLELTGIPAGGLGLAALTTESVDAYRAYARGVEAFHRAEYRRALAAFEDAVRLDSAFALAWAGMGFTSVGAHGFQEMFNPASVVYRAIDRAVRHSRRLPPDQAVLMRALQAFLQARLGDARSLVDSLVAADPENVSAIELLATLHAISIYVSQSLAPDTIAAEVTRAVELTRRLLQLDPDRRMAYVIPAMIYGHAGGLFWGHTWADDRRFTSMPFLILSVSGNPKVRYVPLVRDSVITFAPMDSFQALSPGERRRLRRPGADLAMQWVREWLMVGSGDAEAHLWASRIAELQGNYDLALRSFVVADSLGIQTGLESAHGRAISLLVLAGHHERAGAYTDSLLAAGALGAPPFLASVDRRWSYGAAALLLGRRWRSAGRLAELVNVRRRLPVPCEGLAHEMALVDAPVTEAVRAEVMRVVAAHIGEVRAEPSLAPCATMLSGALLRR